MPGKHTARTSIYHIKTNYENNECGPILNSHQL